MSDVYDADILKQLGATDALVWDGDPYHCSGFTKIVPQFLRASRKRIAVAFKIDKGVCVQIFT